MDQDQFLWHHPLVGHRPKETRAVHQIAGILGVLPLENSEISNKSQRLICARGSDANLSLILLVERWDNQHKYGGCLDSPSHVMGRKGKHHTRERRSLCLIG